MAWFRTGSRRTTTLIQSQRGLEPSNRAFLRALCSVALREDHAVDSGSRSRLFNGASKHIRVMLPNAAEPASLVMPDDDETPAEIEMLGELGDDYLVSVPVPQDITLTGQIKYASSILLNSVEENQFLPWTWSRITPSELRSINAWMAKALKVGDVEDRLLAAVLWIAMATGRSLAVSVKPAASFPRAFRSGEFLPSLIEHGRPGDGQGGNGALASA